MKARHRNNGSLAPDGCHFGVVLSPPNTLLPTSVLKHHQMSTKQTQLLNKTIRPSITSRGLRMVATTNTLSIKYLFASPFHSCAAIIHTFKTHLAPPA